MVSIINTIARLMISIFQVTCGLEPVFADGLLRQPGVTLMFDFDNPWTEIDLLNRHRLIAKFYETFRVYRVALLAVRPRGGEAFPPLAELARHGFGERLIDLAPRKRVVSRPLSAETTCCDTMFGPS